MVSSGALASTVFATDEPLTVPAGEVVRVRVLTRDKFLNPSARQALDSVFASLTLVKPTNPLVTPQAAPPTPPSSPGNPSGKAEANPLAETVQPVYKGDGIHEADFIRHHAGRYEAKATLRDEPVLGGKGFSLALHVIHDSVHPPSCTCKELQQSSVDPRALTAALEREHVRVQQ